MSESWTLLKLLRWMTGYFSEKGINNPRLDAELLLAHQFGLDRVGLYLNHDRPLTTKELEGIRPLIKRRGLREPLQYLIGQAEFWSLSFLVTPAVLIPRPDTEVLVEEALKRCGPTGMLLDAGIGSGAILVSLLKELPGWKGMGIDLSAEALDVAWSNVDRHQLLDRARLVQGDIRALPDMGFDVIVSNPPYISTAEWYELMPEVRDFEPSLALLGGADGLDYYRHLTAQAARRLSPGGWLLMEIGAEQADAVKDLCLAAGMMNIFLRCDYSGNPRVVGANRIG